MFDNCTPAGIRGTIIRRILSVGLALTVAPCAFAQDSATASEDDGLIGEVTVTAQKREQSIQDVGISVTAFSGDQIKELAMTSSGDIVAQTPGLNMSKAGAGSINVFAIRGATQPDFAANQEGPVAVYVDEAYISQNVITNFSLYDLERVEVLRGPQGTLFGRNATGGLVQYLTRRPSQQADGFAEVQVGSKGRRRFEGAVGGGLTDTVSGRLSGQWNESDGLMKNLIGKDGQAADDWSVRGQLLIEPNSDLKVWLKGEYAKDDSTRGNYFHRVGQAGEFTPPPATDFFGYRKPDEDDYWTGAWDFDGYNKAKVSHFTGKVEWQVGVVGLTYIGDFQDIDHAYGEDSDVSPANTFNYTQTSDVQQWSHELRASWEGERTRVAAGAYALNIDGDYTNDSLVFGQEDFDWSNAFYGIPEPGGYRLVSNFSQKTKTWAVFTQLDFDLTEKLTFTAGGRWSHDKKNYSFDQAWLGAEGLYVFFEGAAPGDVPYFDFNDSLSKGDWSGKLQLDYKINSDLLVYASVNRGIKSGGFNAPVDASGLLAVNAFGQFIPFAQNDDAMRYDGEVLTSYESGIKSSWLNGKARLNVSAFYYDYSDYQIYNLEGLTQTVFNSDGKMKGGEVEFAASPVRGLDILLGLSLLDTKVDLPAGIRPDGRLTSDASLAPKKTFNALVRYELPPLGNGTFAVQADFQVRGRQIFNLSNTAVVREGSNTLVNAAVSYSSGDSGLYGMAFVKNVFDERYREYGFDTTGGFGSVEGIPGLERWYGLSLGYRWR